MADPAMASYEEFSMVVDHLWLLICAFLLFREKRHEPQLLSHNGSLMCLSRLCIWQNTRSEAARGEAAELPIYSASDTNVFFVCQCGTDCARYHVTKKAP